MKDFIHYILKPAFFAITFFVATISWFELVHRIKLKLEIKTKLIDLGLNVFYISMILCLYFMLAVK